MAAISCSAPPLCPELLLAVSSGSYSCYIGGAYSAYWGYTPAYWLQAAYSSGTVLHWSMQGTLVWWEGPRAVARGWNSYVTELQWVRGAAVLTVVACE